MDPLIEDFLAVVAAFQKGTGYSEGTASRLALGNGYRIERIKAGARTSIQALQSGVERLSAIWPESEPWPEDVWPRPADPKALAKAKTGRNKTDLALAR